MSGAVLLYRIFGRGNVSEAERSRQSDGGGVLWQRMRNDKEKKKKVVLIRQRIMVRGWFLV